MTKAQLLKFIKTRNASDHQSNLQFQFDLEACGMKLADLGDAFKVKEGRYWWETPHGLLIEEWGKMRLDPDGVIKVKDETLSLGSLGALP